MYKKEQVELGGEKFMIKEGALHRQLKTKGDYKFSKMVLQKLNKKEVGEKFKFQGNEFKMTPLLKRRITLAINLMGKKK